jgi:uncharacterized membrane protein/DNA-directed RNA polymerase subunit RPC12/RpoP
LGTDYGGKSEMTVLYCASCGKAISETSNFCIYCGAEVEHAAQISDVVESESAQESLMDTSQTECNVCGSVNEPDSKFCFKCAAYLNEKTDGLTQDKVIDSNDRNKRSAEPEVTSRNLKATFWNSVKDRINREAFERIIVANWLIILGSITVAASIFFLAALLIDRNLLDRESAAISGMLIGNILIGVGELGRQNRRISSGASARVTLAGAVVALVSFSYYLSSADEGNSEFLLPVITAYTLLIMTLAAYRKLEPLGVVGLVAGIAAQITVFSSSEATEYQQSLVLIGLVVLVPSALFAVSRRWTVFKSVAVVGGFAFYLSWMEYAGQENEALAILLFAAVSMLGLTTVLGRSVVKRINTYPIEYAPILIYSCIFMIACWSSFENPERGYFALSVGAIFLFLAYYFHRVVDDMNLSTLLSVIGVVITLAGVITIGLLFDRAISVMLSTLATLLFFQSRYMASNDLKNIGVIVHVSAVIFMLSMTHHKDPVWVSFIVYGSVISGLFASYIVYTTGKSELTSRIVRLPAWFIDDLNINRTKSWVYKFAKYDVTQSLLIVQVNFVVLFSLALSTSIFIEDIIDTNDNHQFKSLAITILWSIYATLMLIRGMQIPSRFIRYGALFILGITTLKLFMLDTYGLDELFRVIAYLALGLLLISGGLAYKRQIGFIKRLVKTKK